jgi:DNA-binding PadR family transcriptional regulator
MHPYEVATTLRQRQKHESIKLNYGSLYSVVESLEKRGLVEAKETERAGRFPERTIYALTDAGRQEVLDWMGELVSTPTKEYPSFEAALSFLGVLPPEEVVSLLKERALHLEVQLVQWEGIRELVVKRGLPRLFWVENEYAMRLVETELDFVRQLSEDIEGGVLEGIDFWRQIHSDGPDPAIPPEWSATTTTHDTSDTNEKGARRNG